MPDFSSLHRRVAGQAVKPVPLPAGNYQGQVVNREFGESSKKKTPYVRFNLVPTDWPSDASEDAKQQKGPDGDLIQIDLSKKKLNVDYYYTDDALFMLDDMLKSFGLNLQGGGMTYEQAIEEIVGRPCVITVIQEIIQEGDRAGEPFAKARGIRGL